jgi:hypothetical protein
VTRRKQIDPDVEIGQWVLEATGQPAFMIGKAFC